MARQPKYQVFISSTYLDLRQEREAVVWRVLKARHIPVGMENFTATQDRGWDTIQRVLDDTDYYVLILAGMYGSIDLGTGISWTEREYRYAIEKKIPVVVFLRKESHITVANAEKTDVGRTKLREFLAIVRANHLCVQWEEAEDLSGAVVDALRNHIVDDEGTSLERPGWFRGDQVLRPEVANELARLSEQNAKLQQEILSKARAEHFAAEVVRFRGSFKVYDSQAKGLINSDNGDGTALIQHIADFFGQVARHFYVEYNDFLGDDLQQNLTTIQNTVETMEFKDRDDPRRKEKIREVAQRMLDFSRTLYERSLKY